MRATVTRARRSSWNMWNVLFGHGVWDVWNVVRRGRGGSSRGSWNGCNKGIKEFVECVEYPVGCVRCMEYPLSMSCLGCDLFETHHTSFSFSHTHTPTHIIFLSLFLSNTHTKHISLFLAHTGTNTKINTIFSGFSLLFWHWNSLGRGSGSAPTF